MAARGIAAALAGKIFQLQRQTHGGVPGNIVACARRIKDGGGSPSDLAQIRQYLGISKSGASQFLKGTQEIKQSFGRLAQGAVLADVASRGGATGLIAGAQLITQLTQSLDRMAKTKALDPVIARYFQKPEGTKKLEQTIRKQAFGAQLKTLPRLQQISAAQGRHQVLMKKALTGALSGPEMSELQKLSSAMPGMDVEQSVLSTRYRDASKAMQNPIGAELSRLSRMKKAGAQVDEGRIAELQKAALGEASRLRQIGATRYSIGRGLRTVGAVARAGAFGVAATKFVVGMGEALGGAGNFEGVREAQQQANILGASRETNFAARRAAELNVELEKVKGKTGFLPIGGDTVGRFLNGNTAEAQGFYQTRADLNGAGMGGDVQKLRELGRDRVMTRDFGLLGGKKMGQLDEMLKTMGWSSADLEAKISGEVSKMIGKVSQLKNEAEIAAGRREFGVARKLLAEANKELPGVVSAWENPNDIYKRQVGDRAAERMWSRSQMARAGSRTGD